MTSLFYVARQMTLRPLLERAGADDPGLRSIANRQITRCQALGENPGADDGFQETACADVDGLLERLELAHVRISVLGQALGERLPAVLGVLADVWERRMALARAGSAETEDTLAMSEWRELRNVKERNALHGLRSATVRVNLLEVAALALAQVLTLDRCVAAEYSVTEAAESVLNDVRCAGNVACRLVVAPVSLNVRTQDSLRAAAALAIAARPEALYLDFSATETMDGSGIGALVGIRKRCAEAQVRLRIENVQPTIRTLLEMTKLDTLLDVALEGRDD